MQSLKGETDHLFATIQRYESETKNCFAGEAYGFLDLGFDSHAQK